MSDPLCTGKAATLPPDRGVDAVAARDDGPACDDAPPVPPETRRPEAAVHALVASGALLVALMLTAFAWSLLEHHPDSWTTSPAWWTLVLVGAAGVCVHFFLGRRAAAAIRRQMAGIERSHARLELASAAAEQASVAKTQFLANMSHEIRTPMTAILGYADLLLDPGQSDSSRRDSALTIRRNGEHLLSIINNILDISKIESGQMSIETLPTDPGALLEEVCSLMRVRAANRGVGLTLRISGTLPARVLTDPTRLKQILINIVGNAIKFTEHGGVILTAFAVSSPEPGLRFEIADSGIGMTPEQVARLFRDFSQADASTTRRFGGTGLGLSISQRLAAMLGGDITVSSEPGRGSTFTLAIAAPVLRESDPDGADLFVVPRSAAAPPPTSDLLPLAGARILLAEDGPDNQRLIAFHLSRAGATVELAENGRVALDRLERADAPAPDLVLMDMQMPVMDGYEAARSLKARQYPVPVVALTAHAMNGDRDRCIQSGCCDYLTKPIDRAALVQTCARWLAVSRANNRPQPAAHPAAA